MGQSLSLLSSYFSFGFSKILPPHPRPERLIPTTQTCLAFHILVSVMGFNHLCRCLTIYVDVQETNIKMFYLHLCCNSAWGNEYVLTTPRKIFL